MAIFFFLSLPYFSFFFFNDTATTEIYTLSLHDALPISHAVNLSLGDAGGRPPVDAFVSAINYAVAHGVVVVTAAADDTVTDQGQPASLVQPAGTGPDLSSNLGLSVTSADLADGPSGGGVGSEISMAAYGSFDTFDGGSGPKGIF